MDENRVEGTARNLGGKVQEGVGRLPGDARTRAKAWPTRQQGRPRIYTAKQPILRVSQQRPLIDGCAAPSKPSLTQLL
jgi:hypothetical protein